MKIIYEKSTGKIIDRLAADAKVSGLNPALEIADADVAQADTHLPTEKRIGKADRLAGVRGAKTIAELRDAVIAVLEER